MEHKGYATLFVDIKAVNQLYHQNQGYRCSAAARQENEEVKDITGLTEDEEEELKDLD